jgi:hypothetical protein
MRTVRLALAVAAMAPVVAWGGSAGASSASTTLGVSVRVVRSCAVQARAVDAGSAAVRLACSSGHDSNVLVGDAQLAPPRGSFRVSETDAPAAPDAAVRVVTLNF